MKVLAVLIILGLIGSNVWTIYSLGKSDCKTEVAVEKKEEVKEGVKKKKAIRKKLADSSDADLDASLSRFMRPNL